MNELREFAGKEELEEALLKLGKAIENGRFEGEWTILRNVRKRRALRLDGYQTAHFMKQAEFVLRYFGTEYEGKKILFEMVNKCINADDTLENAGLYLEGIRVNNRRVELEIPKTCPLLQWTMSYRRTNGLALEKETAIGDKGGEGIDVSNVPTSMEKSEWI